MTALIRSTVPLLALTGLSVCAEDVVEPSPPAVTRHPGGPADR